MSYFSQEYAAHCTGMCPGSPDAGVPSLGSPVQGTTAENSARNPPLMLEKQEHNVFFWCNALLETIPKDTAPQKQLALDKSLKHAIKEEGNEIKVQVEQAAEGLHERFDETQQLVRELKELVVGKGKKAAAKTSKKVATALSKEEGREEGRSEGRGREGGREEGRSGRGGHERGREGEVKNS